MAYDHFEAGATRVAEVHMANYFNGAEWQSLVQHDAARRAAAANAAELAAADAEITRVLGHGFMQMTGEAQTI